MSELTAMKDSIRLKLNNLKDRSDEIEALLSDAEIIAIKVSSGSCQKSTVNWKMS